MSNFSVRYIEDYAVWSATCWFLPHLEGHGPTEEIAINNIKDLVALWAEQRIHTLGDKIMVTEPTGGLHG